MPSILRQKLTAIAAALAMIVVPAAAQTLNNRLTLNDRLTGDIFPVHDPAMIKAGNTYYLFNTSQANEPPGLIHVRTSKDLVTWTRAGAVFPAIPEWATKEIRGTKGIWAPDISFSHGQYRLYYAVSTFGSNRSAIGLATTPTLDPAAPGHGWTDQGEVFASKASDPYNAIDANAVHDRDGGEWLVFGSFWTGIKMVHLDPATGKLADPREKPLSLARRPNPDAIEAPFIIDHGDYYYLFASHDYCCRGVNSSYYEIVGRSRAVTGPYVDYDGKALMQGAGQIVLHAKLDPTHRYLGPGGASILHDGNKDYIVYHAYDARAAGKPVLRIAELGWTADGWPVARR